MPPTTMRTTPTRATATGMSTPMRACSAARRRSSRATALSLASRRTTRTATSGATNTTLNRRRSRSSSRLLLSDSTIAAMTAKYGIAVGSSTSMIPAPSRNDERPTWRSLCSTLPLSRDRTRQSTAAATRAAIPRRISIWCWTVAPGRGTASTRSFPGPKMRMNPPTRLTRNTPTVNEATLLRAFFVVARKSAGPTVVGLAESMAATATTRAMSASTRRIYRSRRSVQLERLAHGALLRAPQERGDAVRQLARRERLRDEVDLAAVASPVTEGLLAVAGHAQHGQVRLALTRRACELEAAHPGHHEVGEQHRDLAHPLVDHAQRLLAVGRDQQLVLRALEHPLEEPADELFVLDEDDQGTDGWHRLGGWGAVEVVEIASNGKHPERVGAIPRTETRPCSGTARYNPEPRPVRLVA